METSGMQPPPHHQRKPHRRAKRRSAAAVMSVLFSVGAILGVAALALDLALIAFKYQKMQTSCEAATLAGTAQLSDRSLLCKNLQHLDLPVRIPQGQTAVAVQLALAESQVQSYAAQNTGDGDTLELDRKDTSAPLINTIAGWVDNPTKVDSQMTPWSGRGPLNSLKIQASHTTRGGNPITMTIGRLLGVPGADVVASARASYVQRIYGFRPTAQTSVPMLPLVVIPEAGAGGWLDQVCRATEQGNDRFQANVITGEVLAGQDQVGEIELRFLLTKSPDERRKDRLPNVFISGLTGVKTNPEIIQQLTQWGYGRADLIPYGGEFSLNANRRQRAPVVAKPEDSLLRALAQQFALIRGQRRIVPLGILDDQSEDNPQCMVFDFAAVRVVDWRFADENFVVIVQPCLLNTCTGLFRAGEPRNPWIGKLALTH